MPPARELQACRAGEVMPYPELLRGERSRTSNGPRMAVFVPAPQLDIQTHSEGGHWLVEVRGDIDLANVEALEAELTRLSGKAVVLDLSQVGFIDCTGIALLFRTAGRLTVRAVSSTVQQALRICDFEIDVPA